MYAKIVKGGTFKGVLNYVLDEKRAKLLEANGVLTTDKDSIAQSFITQSKLKPNIKKPVAHISLNFSVLDKDRITDEYMKKVAHEYMEKMGFKDTQYIIARHYDKEHPHLHIILNRIDNNGKTISDKNDRSRSSKICKELTKKHGLYISSGKENVKRERLKGADKIKYEIYDALKATIPECENWDELKSELLKQGITTQFKYKGKTNEIQGVSFGKNGYSFSGSKIDRACSYSKIDFQLHQNEQMQQTSQTHDLHKNVTPIVSESTGIAKGLLGIIGISGGSNADSEPELNRKKKKRKGISL